MGAGTIGVTGPGVSSVLANTDTGPGQIEGFDVTLVQADSEFGFNYPYYLYAPERSDNEPRPLLVEPNNSGGATDDFEPHRKLARVLLKDHWPKTISDELGAPLLVPVFPRPQSDPVDVTHYVHALDTETMQIESGDLARVDLQLRRMVEHAKGKLAEHSYAVADRISMNGFSASGNFVNRFTALHPDLVTSVTAGGINGTAILPLEEANGHTLNYQIGVSNLPELIGHAFDRDRWVEVDQFIYMGAEDDNDTIPPADTDIPEDRWDAWGPEQREIALDVYGDDMLDERMPYCESVYDEAGAAARFEIYDGVGHEVTDEIVTDVIEFHRSNQDDATWETTETSSTPGASGPGFGILGSLTGLGAAYAYMRSSG